MGPRAGQAWGALLGGLAGGELGPRLTSPSLQERPPGHSRRTQWPISQVIILPSLFVQDFFFFNIYLVFLRERERDGTVGEEQRGQRADPKWVPR